MELHYIWGISGLAAGLLIGGFAGYMLAKKKFSKKEETKVLTAEDKGVKQIVSCVNPAPPSFNEDGSMTEEAFTAYNNVLKAYQPAPEDIIDPAEMESPVEDDDEGTLIVPNQPSRRINNGLIPPTQGIKEYTPDEYEWDGIHEKVECTLYTGGEMNVVVEDGSEEALILEETVGVDIESWIGHYEEDMAYVLNERLGIIYAVARDTRAWESVYGDDYYE